MKTAVYISDKNSEDCLLRSRISDAVRISQAKQQNSYIGFLNEAEIYKTEEFLHNYNTDYFFWGGYDGAARRFLCILQKVFSPDDVPIVPLEFSYRTSDVLTHRDFLGGIMSLGIERDAVGDILTDSGYSVVFVKESVADFISSQINKIGRVGVKIKISDLSRLPKVNGFTEQYLTVSSLRADAVISALTGFSREKSKQYIRKGMALVNYTVCESPDFKLNNGDIISLRKFGKYIINGILGETKKGRLKLSVKKYS